MEDIIATIQTYIQPELLILIPVLYLLGMGFKRAEWVNDKHIPLLLGAFGIAMSLVYTVASCPVTSWQDALSLVFGAITQGILCAGASVYVNQLLKQAQKGD